MDEEAVVPVLRRTEMKYRKPAKGAVYSKAVYKEADWKDFLETLARRKRALLSIQVDVLEMEDVTVASGIFEWLVAKST